jgi:hypothetical protein
MPDYSEGKIYKLINDVNDKIYIGSTTVTLNARMGGHRSRAKSLARDSPLYSEMRRLSIDHFKIVLIEEFPCKSKIELEKREYHIMRRLIRQEFKLLNSTVEFGRRSDEHRRKIGIAKKGKCIGILSSRFCRGCLFRNERLERRSPIWTFKWQENGKQRSKSFSVKKYGEKRAKRLAEKVQQAIYPLKTSK